MTEQNKCQSFYSFLRIKQIWLKQLETRRCFDRHKFTMSKMIAENIFRASIIESELVVIIECVERLAISIWSVILFGDNIRLRN